MCFWDVQRGVQRYDHKIHVHQNNLQNLKNNQEIWDGGQDFKVFTEIPKWQWLNSQNG
jgi:hypothetical protein